MRQMGRWQMTDGRLHMRPPALHPPEAYSRLFAFIRGSPWFAEVPPCAAHRAATTFNSRRVMIAALPFTGFRPDAVLARRLGELEQFVELGLEQAAIGQPGFVFGNQGGRKGSAVRSLNTCAARGYNCVTTGDTFAGRRSFRSKRQASI